MLSLPSESDLAMHLVPANPAAIRNAREQLRTRLAVHLGELLRQKHTGMQEGGEYSASAQAAGRRALRNAALDLLIAEPVSINIALAQGHFEAAANMTDAIGALSALVQVGGDPAEAALAAFHDKWKNEPLVIDKWFTVQARDPSEGALGRVLALTAHPDFDATNPNRFRALVGAFAVGNPARFHDPSGAGYSFLADQILAVDDFNPMLAARLVDNLGGWQRYTPELGALMKAQLERIAAHPGLSNNVLELATKSLA